MRASILLRQRPVAKCSMFAFEASRKSRRRLLDGGRIHHAVDDERCYAADAIGTREARIAHRLEHPFGPSDARVIGAQRKTEVELREIHGDEVIERSGFDRIAARRSERFRRAHVASRTACG